MPANPASSLPPSCQDCHQEVPLDEIFTLKKKKLCLECFQKYCQFCSRIADLDMAEQPNLCDCYEVVCYSCSRKCFFCEEYKCPTCIPYPCQEKACPSYLCSQCQQEDEIPINGKRFRCEDCEEDGEEEDGEEEDDEEEDDQE